MGPFPDCNQLQWGFSILSVYIHYYRYYYNNNKTSYEMIDYYYNSLYLLD